MSINKEKILKLQVIDLVLLNNLLQRLDENAKHQSMSNALDQSGLNEIISNYNKYLQLPSDSSLKDTYRQNLLSKVAAYKSKQGN